MGAKQSRWLSTSSVIGRCLQCWRTSDADEHEENKPADVTVVEAIHSTVVRFKTPVHAWIILWYFGAIKTHNLYSSSSGLFLENGAILEAADHVLLVPNKKHASAPDHVLCGDRNYNRKFLQYSPVAQTASSPNRCKINVSSGKHVVLDITHTAIDSECADNLAPKHGLRYDRLDSNYADTPGLYFRVPISMRKFFIRPSLPAFFAQIRAERAQLHIVSTCSPAIARAIASLLSRLFKINIDSVLARDDLLQLGCPAHQKDFSVIFEGYDPCCSSVLIVDDNTSLKCEHVWINVPDPVLLCEVPQFEYSDDPQQELPPILQSIRDHYTSRMKRSHDSTSPVPHDNIVISSSPSYIPYRYPVLFVADEKLWTQQTDPSATVLDCVNCGWVVNTSCHLKRTDMCRDSTCACGMKCKVQADAEQNELGLEEKYNRICWRCGGTRSPLLEERILVEIMTSDSVSYSRKRLAKKKQRHKRKKVVELAVIAEECDEEEEEEEEEQEGEEA